MKISIVTVVLNDFENIENTIKSVICQSYNDVEYIIIDGGSTDGTCNVIEKLYCDGGIDIYESNKDNGIYDAMNKGIQKASGDYICFMNSGDTFFENSIIAKVHDRILLNRYPDFIYGNTLVKKGPKERVIKARQFIQIKNTLPFCHQSVFIKLSLHKLKLYNTQYRLASDYDFFAGISLNNPHWSHMDDLTISKITEGGVADAGRLKTTIEYLQIATRHFYIPRWGQVWLLIKVLASMILLRNK